MEEVPLLCGMAPVWILFGATPRWTAKIATFVVWVGFVSGRGDYPNRTVGREDDT